MDKSHSSTYPQIRQNRWRIMLIPAMLSLRTIEGDRPEAKRRKEHEYDIPILNQPSNDAVGNSVHATGMHPGRDMRDDSDGRRDASRSRHHRCRIACRRNPAAAHVPSIRLLKAGKKPHGTRQKPVVGKNMWIQ